MNPRLIANRYKILNALGSGGMGTVYQARDLHTDEVVALKQLKPDVAKNSEIVERFKREGEALRQLNHPNIVKMLNSVQDDDTLYLVIEYIAGGDLKQLLEAETLNIKRIINIALDLADALTRAHRLNIIHRDIKPANVLIAEDGTPRLTDFGVAHIETAERVTDTGIAVGTLDYLSPEALNGEGMSSAADIWAFGVLLFEMLAGERPFTGKTLSEIITAILSSPIPDLEALRSDAPIGLIDLIYRMLEKDPRVRIASVRQIGLELEALLHGRDLMPQAIRFDMPTPVLEQVKHNLPAQTTPFVGRADELRELSRLMSDAQIRLITILAQGGMGKTRLSLELAQEQIPNFAQGVFFVELAPLSDSANIVNAIAEATGYPFQSDGRDTKQQILDFLREKSMLLLLDNFEHLMAGADIVSDILQSAAQVKIIVTSRQRLNQTGETIFHLGGMDFPDWETPQDALEYSAVKLFMQSARRIRPDFELTADDLQYIARICRLVEGMPLGILLAASWLEILSPPQIAGEMAQSLDFLETEMRDIPERQRSIRAVFEYSWNLLTPDEQSVFMKLSVFRGGFTREAAQSVAGANLRNLMTLVNKSLLHRDNASGRYQIHELLRQFGETYLLQSGELDMRLDQHMNYFADFLRTCLIDIKGRRQLPVLKEIEADFANIRTAWNRAISQVDYEVLERSMETLFLFCDIHSMYVEAKDLFESAVSSLALNNRETSHPVWTWLNIWVIRVQLLFEIFSDDILPQLEHYLAIAEADDNKVMIACCLLAIGNVYRHTGNMQTAIPYFEKSFDYYKNLGDSFHMVYSLRGLVFAYQFSGLDYRSKAKEINQTHINLARQIGDYAGLAHGVLYEGAFAHFEYNYALCERHIREALAIWTMTNDRKSMGICLGTLGNLAFLKGEFAEAGHWAKEVNKMWTYVPYQQLKDYGNHLDGLITLINEDYSTAHTFFENVSLAYIDIHDNYPVGIILNALSLSSYALFYEDEAGARIYYVLKICNEPFNPVAITACLPVVAILLAQFGQKERATEILALAFVDHVWNFNTWMYKWSRLTQLREELESELGTEAYQAAWKRGQLLDLETTAKELLNTFKAD